MTGISKKQEKREKILAAAKSLFNHTHDVKRVSLEAIAVEAGVSPTTIYNNFGDRESLIFELIKEMVSANLERNRALVHSNIPFPQKIISVFSGKMELAEKVDREIIEKLLTQDKKIAPYIDEIYEQQIKPLWKAMMADGKKQGYVDASLDDEALLLFLDIIQAGLKVKADIFRDFKDNMKLIEQLTHMMFYGFMKKDIDLFRKEEKQSHD
jgi:AcrR family transcriptional regulator